MKHKFLALTSFVFMVLLLSGCTQNQQLHQKLIIQGVGIEKEEKNYKVIVQALDFQNPLNENEPNTKVIETEGETVTEALDNISKQTSLTAVYSQNLMLILGEKAAKFGVNDFIDFFIRHCETRPKVKICISKTAFDILKISPNDKSLKSKNIHDLVPLQLNSDVLHFVSSLKNEKTDPFAAWIEMEGKKEVHLKGAGIFKGDKLESLLEGKEAFGFMALKGTPKFGSLVVNSEETGDVTCRIEKVIPKISAKVNENDMPEFEINLDTTASSFSLDKNFYTHNPQQITGIIEENFSKNLTEICENLLKKTLKSKIDVFDFAKILKNSNPKYFKKIEDDWKEILPNLNCKVSVKTKLKVTGKEPV